MIAISPTNIVIATLAQIVPTIQKLTKVDNEQ